MDIFVVMCIRALFFLWLYHKMKSKVSNLRKSKVDSTLSRVDNRKWFN